MRSRGVAPEDPRTEGEPSAAAVCVSRDEQSNDLSSGISPTVLPSHLYYTSGVTAQVQIRVKLNRVFFPRYRLQARSLDCGFAG